MPTHFAFRLSAYLTLAFSCLAMAYAEWHVLPVGTFVGLAVLALLMLAFYCEGRYELSLKHANALGLVIGIVVMVWLAYQFVNRSSLLYRLPWPASLLPYLGPILMVLMPAKLFRPKHTGDWWAMQGIALANAALGCAIEDDTTFAILVGMYGVVAIWSLSLFYYLRVGGVLPPVPKDTLAPVPTILASRIQVEQLNFGREFFFRSLGWIAVASMISVPLFFLTPRSNAPQWKFGTQRLETGLSDGQFVDLNRAGDLNVNREVVLEFQVTDRVGAAYEQVSPEQRFRVYSFNEYSQGRWQKLTADRLLGPGTILPMEPDGPRTPRQNEKHASQIGSFGPDQLQFSFQPRVRNDWALVDPVRWVINDYPPIQTIHDDEEWPWLQLPDTHFSRLRLPPVPRHVLFNYRQMIPRETAEPDVSPGFELAFPFPEIRDLTTPRSLTPPSPDNPVLRYRSMNLERLRKWSQELFRKLAETNPDVEEAIKRAKLEPDFHFVPQDYEVVSKALTAYFSSGQDYKYSLNLRRIDPMIDPAEEFLFTIKEGHCERYATATCLVLRAVGIPANYVSGYKGCEQIEPGRYVIRQEHAHAWVEVLIPRPAPANHKFRIEIGKEGWHRDKVNGQTVLWHWHSFDPTPGVAEEETETKGTLANFWDRLDRFFDDYVIGYNPDRRAAAFQSVLRWFGSGSGMYVLVGIGVVAAVMAMLMLRRKRRAKRMVRGTGVIWYDRFCQLIADYNGPSIATATPHELGEWLQATLQDDRPAELALAYNRMKYGGQLLTPDDETRLTELVDAFAVALQKRGRS
ncbi:MAG: DUF3488 and transglutaminase-like domain-containing protein [Fimbriiglobus sp.]